MIKRLLKKFIPYRIYSKGEDFLRYFSSLKYAGKNYKCPFCNGNFSKMKPVGVNSPAIDKYNIVGGGYRQNAICPRCLSSDRERLIYFYLIENQKKIFTENVTLLHIAPERNLSKYFQKLPNIKYFSGDLSSPLANIKMDITDIKQEDEIYDVIICNHVLEHITNDLKAMSELYRVLKKGGFAILQVPISYSIDKTFEDNLVINPDDREKIFGQKDHVRIYGRDYFKRLEKVGFKVKIVDQVKKMNKNEVEKYSLLPEEKLILAYK